MDKSNLSIFPFSIFFIKINNLLPTWKRKFRVVIITLPRSWNRAFINSKEF